jgi:hypothetical protein
MLAHSDHRPSTSPRPGRFLNESLAAIAAARGLS